MSDAVEIGETAEWATSAFKRDNRGKLVVLFHEVQVYHEFLSKQENRPRYVTKTFIKKIVPADNMVIDRPIRETDKEEFAEQWEHYQRTKENKIPGIPIEHWHSITDSQKEEFKALKIFTVEQFANLPDSAASKIMGFYEIRQKAKVFIEAGKDAELMGQLRQQMAMQDVEHQKQIQELTAAIAELKKTTVKKFATKRRKPFTGEPLKSPPHGPGRWTPPPEKDEQPDA